MRVVLIQPRKVRSGVEAQEHWQLARPLSLFFLAAAIRQRTNHQVEILDFESARHLDVDFETVLADVGEAAIFGITATTYTRLEAQRLAQIIRRLYPDTVIVAGGVHFMYAASDALEGIPEIDIVVRGEGEITLLQILNSLETGAGLDRVKGVSFRRDSSVIHNPPQDEFIDPDVTDLFLDYSWDEYPEYLFSVNDKVPAVSIMASRGCPFSCAFCAKSETRYVTRSPSKVVDDIELLTERFGISAFNFLDLSFTVEARHVRNLCEEIIGRNLNIKWWCESRANTPPQILELMARAGCVSTVVGVESGSPNILSSLAKGISVEQAVRFCHGCRDLGISVQPYFMYSLPGETRADAERTLDLIEELEVFTRSASFQPCMIFPGTKVETIAREEGLLDDSFSWAEPYHSEFNVELGQLPNIPLFLDRMTEDDLRYLAARRAKQKRAFEKNANIRAVAENVSQMSFSKLVGKIFHNALTGKPVWRYALSPSLFSQIARARRSRRER